MKILFNSIALVVLATIVQAEFSDSFRNYFAGQPELLKVLSRNDLFGANRCFGGGNHVGGVKTERVPIIIVHAGASNAGVIQKYYRPQYIERGYSDETVYTTTWGNTTDTSQRNLEMKCEYVKQIRRLILAVSNFTNNQVDIVAHGEGSPIARKAVIGGKCVDTNEELGVPLTKSVRAFVSDKGINGGIPCDPKYDTRRTCLNMDIGLNCASKFMKDINAKGKREAVHSIHSLAQLRPWANKMNCGLDVYLIPDSKVFRYDYNGIEENVHRVVEILKNQ
ncbi:LIPaSe related [Caenorhabditis elegans]|uniref:LIPaSe related n=1 Tax=Caenorhabditis elegans TaxID=6239 RepID=O17377_CAEEL|nr:LIPaSe related [Caenorhabditis elegans]CCD63493.1 LIPaSe related [Caenorhabditis elegans]|eukprot:NP_493916.2 LIPaSe related [Caenorhabditis elegans]